jgi:septal ring factor EnvC (AmiA/AmiB activator)
LIEEIETMGRSEKRELESRLTVIAEHLLKLTYWLTEKETNAQGWRSTVVEQRRQVQRLLKESPSLRRLIPEIWIDCYQAAREDTVRKYQLAADLFPIESPFTLAEILDYDYLP